MPCKRFAATEVVDDSVFDTASFATINEIDFPQPPERVWAVLCGDRIWAWLPPFSKTAYATGVRVEGAVRNFCWAWFWHLEQRFIDWDDEAMTHMYYVPRCNIPILGVWAERYTLSQLPGGGTRLHWVVAFTPRRLSWLKLEWTAPVVGPILRRLGARTIKKELARS